MSCLQVFVGRGGAEATRPPIETKTVGESSCQRFAPLDAPDRLLDRRCQRVRRDRFPKEVSKSVRIDIADIGTGNDDDRNMRCFLLRAKVSVNVDPWNVRENQIEHHGRRPVDLNLLQRVIPIWNGDDAIAGEDERLPVHLTRRPIVFND
jgi:hypothetical protein